MTLIVLDLGSRLANMSCKAIIVLWCCCEEITFNIDLQVNFTWIRSLHNIAIFKYYRVTWYHSRRSSCWTDCDDTIVIYCWILFYVCYYYVNDIIVIRSYYYISIPRHCSFQYQNYLLLLPLRINCNFLYASPLNSPRRQSFDSFLCWRLLRAPIPWLRMREILR